MNNVSFFKYIQSARVNFWDQIGLTESHRETNIGPLLASCKCEFKQVLLYPGSIMIRSIVEFIGNTSFGLHHQIFNDNGELAAEGHDVMVMFDFNKNKKELFPDTLRKKIKALE